MALADASAAPICVFTAVPNIQLGTYDPLRGSSASATIGWSCSNPDSQTAYIRLCTNIGAGSGGGTPGASRLLSDGAGHTLGFQLYKTPAIDASQIWGSPDTPAWSNVQTLVPALGRNGGTASGTATLYGHAPAGNTSEVVPGTYTSVFTNAIALKYAYRLSGGGSQSWPTDCQAGTTGNATSTFSVSASIAAACTVTASELNFGAVDGQANAVNVDGQSTISVNCSMTTPYTISLTPSNGSTTGTGLLSATGGVADNADKVPYQLYRNAARTTSAYWGNMVGTNTMPGQGSGATQTFPVYGRLPSANVTPDSYQDTVTIHIRY